MREIFACQCCGHCCHGEGTVSLTPVEQKTIASFLGLELSAFSEQYCTRQGNRVEMKVTEGHCIFYGANGLCRIHAVKPFHCKRWPLHPSILGDRAAWKAIKADCPGFSPDATYDEVCTLVRSVTSGS
jgi:Fe-S-cluster containining protein